METQYRERSRVDYANYEYQMPDRDMSIRTVNYQPNSYQGGYDNMYPQGYAQPTQGYAQPTMEYPQQQQSAGFFQTQASEYIANRFNAPQYDNYNYTYANPQEQSQQGMQYGRVNRINQICERDSWKKKFSKQSASKKSINKDMIKVIVTIMVLAIVICSLLIANQFISANQAQAEEDVQNIDSDLLASVVTEEGSYVSISVTIIPEYEYEQSTNWFDKLCDNLGFKLK